MESVLRRFHDFKLATETWLLEATFHNVSPGLIVYELASVSAAPSAKDRTPAVIAMPISFFMLIPLLVSQRNFRAQFSLSVFSFTNIGNKFYITFVLQNSKVLI